MPFFHNPTIKTTSSISKDWQLSSMTMEIMAFEKAFYDNIIAVSVEQNGRQPLAWPAGVYISLLSHTYLSFLTLILNTLIVSKKTERKSEWLWRLWDLKSLSTTRL